jgi:hypothetical protein
MFVQTQKIKTLLPGLLLAAMLAFLLLFSPVYAEGETPPDESSPISEDSPAAANDETQESASHEETSIEDTTIDDPLADPAEEPAAELPEVGTEESADSDEITEEFPAADEPLLVDSNGEPLDLASQETSELLADPDPYFYVGGVLYNFTTTDCDPITPGDQGCANPIQAAINYLSSNNLSPDGGKIYVEAGSYPGFTINGSSWTLNKPTLIDLIGAGSGSTNITTSVTISNMVNFYMTGFNLINQLNFQSNTGTIKLTDVKIKYTGGTGLFITSHSGPVSINNLTVYESNGNGAYIDNTNGTGSVTITNSYFKNNNSDGLTIYSNGAVTLSNVHSSKNTNSGAYINNIAISGTPLVKVSLSTFTDNSLAGLQIFSKGNISLDNVVSAGNSHKGAILANDTGTGTVVVKNSQFIANSNTGLDIYSSKNVTLDGVMASNNSNAGVNIENQTSPTSGSPVTILRSHFSGNGGNGLAVLSKSLIKLDGVTALNNGSSGANLANSFSGATGGVTISAAYGENHFNDNGVYGLLINSYGSVSLSRVFVNGNSETGVYINNSGGPGNVSIGQSRFEYNGSDGGVVIYTKGAVTIDRVVASYNSGSGIYINNAIDFSSPKTIKITRSSFEFNTTDSGLFIDAKSNVEINNVTSSFNNNYGVRIDNCQFGIACEGKGSISFLSSMGPNTINNNWLDNINIHASGNLLFSKVTANSSGNGSGIWASNTSVIANITLANVNTLFNTGYGTFAYTAGSIKVTNSNFSNNTIRGGYFSTTADTTGLKTISISSSIFNNTSGSHGLDINGTGNVTLSNITATDNLTGYGVRIDNAGGLGSVLLAGTSNQLLNNGLNGLFIGSYGTVTVSNLNSSNNSRWGAEIYNYDSPTKQPVIVKNSNFNHNGASGSYGGIYISSQGNILVDLVNASNNPGTWAGGSISNTQDTTGLKTITIQRSNFNFNGGGGVGVGSYGTITLNNVSASYNYGPFAKGASINNLLGTGSIIINNSMGENLFIGNVDNGLLIYTSNNITLRSVRAVSNGGNGAYMELSSALSGSTTIIGSTFSSNGAMGFYLSTNRNVTLDNVNAHQNGSDGIYVYANYGPVDTQTTTITRSKASNNTGYGIYVESRGLITLNTFKVFNNGEHGLYIYNNNGGASMGINILSQYGSNWTSGNIKTGAYLNSAGPVTISKIVALGNGIVNNWAGLFIQTTNNQNITLTCALLSGNGYHGLTANLGTGTLTLNGVTAYGNDVFGGSVDPDIFNNVGSTVITNPASCGSFQ